jgi:WD40 repeat protein
MRLTLAAFSLLALLGVIIGVILIGSDIVSGVERGITSAFGMVDLSPAAQETREASMAHHMVYSIPQGKGVVYNPTGDELAISGLDNTATVREAATGKVLLELRGHRDRVNNIAYSSDGRRLATTSMDGSVKIWSADTGVELLSLRGTGSELVSPALSPDASLVAATSFNSQWRRLTTRVWDTTTREELFVLGFGEHIGGLDFSPDGMLLAMPGTVGKVTIWDVATGKQQFSLTEHEAPVTDVVFSSDGQRLLTVSLDGTARVWDLPSKEAISTMRGHNGDVIGGDISPDGRLVATGGADSTVRIWDAESGRELHIFYGHEEMVTNVAFSPDGRFLSSGGEDNVTIVWHIPE